MTTIKKIIKIALLAAPIIIGFASCKKLDQPALPADYPKDTPVTPTSSLRFALNFDSTSEAAKQLNIRFADSISNYPSFFPDASITAAAGVKGTAFQSAGTSYAHYYNANDMGSAKSFTLAFWMNVPLAKKDNNHAVGIMALASTINFWSEIVVYADNTTKGGSDSMDLKFHFANGTGDNWDFAGYTGNARWPKMYDGAWHHVAFTYDATSKTGIMYRDGAVFDTKTNETIAFDGHADQFILGGFAEANGYTDNTVTPPVVQNYSNNTWMGYFTGSIDQLKMYNVALSGADVANLYNGKQ